MTAALVTAILAPFAAAVVIAMLPLRAPLDAALAAAGSAIAFVAVPLARGARLAIPWLPLARGDLTLTLYGSAWSGVMAALSAGFAAVILLYANDDLADDPARRRFFALMSAFTGAMLLLVFARDLLLVLVAWELIGACSYALIGFWHRDPARVHAASRAFLTTRSADVGMYAAAFVLVAATGASDFPALARLDSATLALVALGVGVAALGKSAQWPLSGWLAGAMLGPTPVSAFLHSATLVAAGAFLLIRLWPYLAPVPWLAGALVALGLVSAVVGATIATAQRDLKQILAASTVSQYGYVFAALGAGAASAAAAQVITHAVFKALLFLVAGVFLRIRINTLYSASLSPRALPAIALTFAVGLLALAPLPPLGGFESKEFVLEALARAGALPFALALTAAVFTGAYSARLWLGIFGGARDAPPPRLEAATRASLFVLAAACLASSAWFVPRVRDAFAAAFATPLDAGMRTATLSLIATSLGIALVYLARKVPRGRVTAFGADWFGMVAMLDTAARGVVHLARALARADGRLERLSVGGAAHTGRALASAAAAIERHGVDATIRALASGLTDSAKRLSAVQAGRLYRYYVFAAAGAAVLLAAALWRWAA